MNVDSEDRRQESQATQSPDVLLVIPCFRESGRIRPLLDDLLAIFSEEERIRILVVEDGSDAEEQIAMRAALDSATKGSRLFLPPLFLPKNLGKGGAVYAGWAQQSEADWLAFVDADRSITASEVRRVLDHVRRNQQTSAFFGSRVKLLGRHVDRHFKRHLIGRVYATLVSELLRIPIYDSQCGFKIIRRTAYEDVKNKLSVSGFAFDVDLLVALTDAGHHVEEVPIDWVEMAGGKVNLIMDSWRMFKDIWKIRQRRQTREKQ
jgi:dolichyl-phosphate beta-glucosyltransferase